MGTKIKLGSALGAAALLVSAACTQDLNVTNPNNPDVARVLASPTDVQSLAVSSVNSWYLAATYYDPWMMMSVTADALTGNFGNFGMRFNNLEPRIDYHNVASDNDAEVAREFGALTESAGFGRRDAIAAIARKFGRSTRDVYAAVERAKHATE